MKTGTVTEWTSRPDADGEGRIRDDEFGETPVVVVFQADVIGQKELESDQRVRYRRELNEITNLFMARSVTIV